MTTIQLIDNLKMYLDKKINTFALQSKLQKYVGDKVLYKKNETLKANIPANILIFTHHKSSFCR